MTTKQERVSDETLEEMAGFYRALRKSKVHGNDELASALTELQKLRAVVPTVRDAMLNIIQFEQYQLTKLHTPKMEQMIELLDSLEMGE